MNINYTVEELQEDINTAQFEFGYYYTAWNYTGSREDRESKSYYNGVCDTLIEFFSKISEGTYDKEAGQEAFSDGENAYLEEKKEDNDD